jgi:hypothetical protein
MSSRKLYPLPPLDWDWEPGLCEYNHTNPQPARSGSGLLPHLDGLWTPWSPRTPRIPPPEGLFLSARRSTCRIQPILSKLRSTHFCMEEVSFPVSVGVHTWRSALLTSRFLHSIIILFATLEGGSGGGGGRPLGGGLANLLVREDLLLLSLYHHPNWGRETRKLGTRRVRRPSRKLSLRPVTS